MITPPLTASMIAPSNTLPLSIASSRTTNFFSLSIFFFERRTEETFLDYRFSKISDSEIEDDSFCVYTLYKNGFLKKTRTEEPASEDILNVIHGRANSTLIGFDCFGRLLRVFGTEILEK